MMEFISATGALIVDLFQEYAPYTPANGRAVKSLPRCRRVTVLVAGIESTAVRVTGSLNKFYHWCEVSDRESVTAQWVLNVEGLLAAWRAAGCPDEWEVGGW